MKKSILLFIGSLFLFIITGCSENKFDVALITNTSIEEGDTLNQTTWSGIQEYCDENNLTYSYYISIDETESAILESINEAVQKGAKIIFAPGKVFETAIYEAQFSYPEVLFVILDGEPHSDGDVVSYEIADNTLSVGFKENEAGFLAGYALVMDGFTRLGFIGEMQDEFVQEYGVGYIAGAYYAAATMDVDLIFSDKHYYQFQDEESDISPKVIATNLFQTGTEVIFTAGIMDTDIIKAAEESEGLLITTNSDQVVLSSAILTSVYKDVKFVVVDTLYNWNNEVFLGGTVIDVGVESHGFQLNTGTTLFNTYSSDQNDEIIRRIYAGSIVVPTKYDELASFFADNGARVEGYPSFDVVTIYELP